MKEYFSEYYIGEVAKAVGVSRELVRYYEKIGLVQSLKDDLNSYRKFDIHLLEELSNIVMFRSLDLSLEAICEVQKTYDTDMEKTLQILQDKAAEHKEELSKLEQKIAMTEVVVKDFRRVKEQTGKISIVQAPDLLLFGLSDILDSQDLASRYSYLVKNYPRLPKYTFILDVEDLGSQKFTLDVYRQFAISAEVLPEWQGEGELLPGRECAYSIYVGKVFDMMDMKYKEMLSWIDSQGYRTCGQALELCDLSIGANYLFEIYIPVSKK